MSKIIKVEFDVWYFEWCMSTTTFIRHHDIALLPFRSVLRSVTIPVEVEEKIEIFIHGRVSIKFRNPEMQCLTQYNDFLSCWRGPFGNRLRGPTSKNEVYYKFLSIRSTSSVKYSAKSTRSKPNHGHGTSYF